MVAAASRVRLRQTEGSVTTKGKGCASEGAQYNRNYLSPDRASDPRSFVLDRVPQVPGLAEMGTSAKRRQEVTTSGSAILMSKLKGRRRADGTVHGQPLSVCQTSNASYGFTARS